MDDELEAPQSKAIDAIDATEGDPGNFSDDEDGGPDWTKMPCVYSQLFSGLAWTLEGNYGSQYWAQLVIAPCHP